MRLRQVRGRKARSQFPLLLLQSYRATTQLRSSRSPISEISFTSYTISIPGGRPCVSLIREDACKIRRLCAIMATSCHFYSQKSPAPEGNQEEERQVKKEGKLPLRSVSQTLRQLEHFLLLLFCCCYCCCCCNLSVLRVSHEDFTKLRSLRLVRHAEGDYFFFWLQISSYSINDEVFVCRWCLCACTALCVCEC